MPITKNDRNDGPCAPRPRKGRAASVLQLLLLLGLVLVVASACRVDTTVTVEFEPDGSGTVDVAVVADRDAVELLGDPATDLRLDDLVESGWLIEDPSVDDESGELTISAARSFSSGEELARILATVGVAHDDPSGPAVPFMGNAELDISETPGRTEYDLRASLRVPAGLESLSDPDLIEVLDGLAVGRTLGELEAIGHDPARGIGDLRIRVRLPGDVESTTGRIDGRYVEWSAPIGSSEETDQELRLKNVVVDRGPARRRAIAAVVLVGAGVLGVVGLLRRR